MNAIVFPLYRVNFESIKNDIPFPYSLDKKNFLKERSQT